MSPVGVGWGGVGGGLGLGRCCSRYEAITLEETAVPKVWQRCWSVSSREYRLALSSRSELPTTSHHCWEEALLGQDEGADRKARHGAEKQAVN